MLNAKSKAVEFEGNDFNIGLERQTANMGTTGSFSYKGNVGGINLTYAIKEVNFESHHDPSGAIIHEGSPEAKTTLDNSDFTVPFKFSTVFFAPALINLESAPTVTN